MTKFEAFVDLYVDELRKRHSDNPHWQTREDIIEMCGGEDELGIIYDLWLLASPEKQKQVCGFTEADLISHLAKDRVWRTAQELFGDAECGYAGFDTVVHAVEIKCNIAIDSHNMANYKWSILDQACVSRPSVTDINLMAKVITEITGITYDPKELDKYQDTLFIP